MKKTVFIFVCFFFSVLLFGQSTTSSATDFTYEEEFMEAVEFGAYAGNGVIEIPVEYRKDYSSGIRVILIKDNHSRYNTEPSII